MKQKKVLKLIKGPLDLHSINKVIKALYRFNDLKKLSKAFRKI